MSQSTIRPSLFGCGLAPVALMYAAIFAVYGLHVPYLSVWLDSRGTAAEMIGWILALPLFLRLIATPSVAIWADATGAHARMILALSGLALIATIMLGGVDGPVLIGLVVIVMVASLQSAMPLIEVVAMRGVRAGRDDYGRQRLWGSVSFIVMTMVGGAAVSYAGGESIQPLLVVTTLLTVGAAWRLSGYAGGNTGHAANTGQTAVQPDGPSVGRLVRQLKGVAAVARQPGRVGFLVAAGLIQASHAVYYAFSALHWQSIGYSGWWIGVLWSIGVIAEIVLFARAEPIVRQFPPERLLLLGAAAAVLRWTVTAFDPPGGVLVGLQVLHALTFGATHLAAMYFIARAIPEEHVGAAQAFSSTVASGVAMGGAMLIAGYAYAQFGAYAYFAMAMIGACVVVYCLVRMAGHGGPR